MRDYFRRAIDVGMLTRLVCAKLEADELKDPPAGIGRFLPADGKQEADEALTAAGFVIRSGRLDFADVAKIEDDPANPKLLRTMRGLGYRMTAPDDDGEAGRR